MIMMITVTMIISLLLMLMMISLRQGINGGPTVQHPRADLLDLCAAVCDDLLLVVCQHLGSVQSTDDDDDEIAQSPASSVTGTDHSVPVAYLHATKRISKALPSISCSRGLLLSASARVVSSPSCAAFAVPASGAGSCSKTE